MKPTKPVLRFLLFFISCYVVLLILGYMNEAGLEKRYQDFGNYFFENFQGKGKVKFGRVAKVEEKHFNTEMILASRAQYDTYKRTGAPFKISTVTSSGWYMAFLPIILLISLVLASPVNWKRMAIALVVGMVLMLTFIWFKLNVQLLYEFNRAELGVVSYGNFGNQVLENLYVLFVKYMGPTFIIPVFIWLVVTFRKGDVARVFNSYKNKTDPFK